MPTRGYNEEDFQFLKELGQRIRARREDLGYKGPTEFARAIGEDDLFGQYVSSVERGMSGPRLRVLMKIAAGLKTTTSNLLGDADAPVADADAEKQYDLGYSQALLDVAEQVRELRRKSG
jgi:transcriptional regulator with XRE-family HTH domain